MAKKEIPLVLAIVGKYNSLYHLVVIEQPEECSFRGKGVRIVTGEWPDYYSHARMSELYVRGDDKDRWDDLIHVPDSHIRCVRAAVKQYNKSRGCRVSSDTPDIIC